MHKYTKITVPFERDTTGSKKLVEGRWSNPVIEYLAPLTWVCTEKIDGTNVGVVWDGYRISYQGRAEKTELPEPLINSLNEMFGGDENEQIFEQIFGEKEMILFGEGYGPGIQKHGAKYRSDISFILFDVYCPSSDTWLKRKAVEEIARALGIDVVPIILEGTLYEALEYVKGAPLSTIGTAPMEGLVCRPKYELRDRSDSRIIVKIKARDFLK